MARSSQKCFFPGCLLPGRYPLGIRLRHPSTDAVFAPNTGVYLCEDHAKGGLQITMELRPTTTGTVDWDITTPGAPKITGRHWIDPAKKP
jgi:hypothetical protein